MKYKILLVEDNEPIRENTTELLEFHDYSVLTANNGIEGLEIALGQNPDLILSDIKMPVMDGYLFLEQIRRQTSLSNTRFVFFTASCEKKDIEMWMKMGADGYIIKPFTEDELLVILKKHLS